MRWHELYEHCHVYYTITVYKYSLDTFTLYNISLYVISVIKPILPVYNWPLLSEKSSFMGNYFTFYAWNIHEQKKHQGMLYWVMKENLWKGHNGYECDNLLQILCSLNFSNIAKGIGPISTHVMVSPANQSTGYDDRHYCFSHLAQWSKIESLLIADCIEQTWNDVVQFE